MVGRVGFNTNVVSKGIAFRCFLVFQSLSLRGVAEGRAGDESYAAHTPACCA